MNKVLTTDELAAYLKVHPCTIYRLLKQRLLPAFKVGSDWRFDVELIDAWIKGKPEKPPPRPVVEKCGYQASGSEDAMNHTKDCPKRHWWNNKK